ncbi:MAG: Rad52/Rad22 family DNA repair protein [Blastocatellales bacterium]
MRSHNDEVIAGGGAERMKSQAKSNINGVKGAKRPEVAEDKKAAQRDKRARSLAAMGLVMREGSRYSVKSAAARGRQESHEVWRDENRRVRCSCAEFERLSADASAFRCEHILAVKYSLTMNVASDENDAQANMQSNQQTAQQSSTTTEEAKPEIHEPGNQEEEQSMNDEEKEVAQSVQTVSEPNQPKLNQEEPPQPAQVVPLAFASLLRTLRQPIDSRLIKTREGWTDRQGNTHWVEYIEWHTVADILDRVAPNWSHAVRNITQVGDMVAVTAAITIDGVTREGIGTGPAESETGIKKAEHDALKRAAVKFGIARELYRRESEVIEEDGGISPNILRDPRPKTLGDLVTPKQLWMIRSLGREAGCDVEQECQSLMQCNLEEISKRAASSLIDYLKRRQQENQPEELRRAS